MSPEILNILETASKTIPKSFQNCVLALLKIIKKCTVMKKILILSAALISTALFAQNPEIPKKYSDNVIEMLIQNYKKTPHRDVYVDGILAQKFQQDFPNAHSVEWETNEEIYEVEFWIKLREFKALYSKEGNLLMYKQEIRERELPAVVKTAAEAKYPKYKFEDIEKKVIGTKTLYEIEMEFRDSEVKVIINNEGKFISEKFDY